MHTYEHYTPTGIEWLGEIPSHWEITKNKFLLTERKGVIGKNASKFKLLSLTLQGVILRNMENPKGKFPAEFDSYKQVFPNDLVFCLFDVEETPRTVGLAKHHGMITGAYTVTCCNQHASSAFLYYYYLSLDEGKRLRPFYTGLRNVITRDTFFSLPVPIPPRDEQDRIVAFLDQKTAEIDAAIAKKERLVELLGEQRLTLIHSMVTKGLGAAKSIQSTGIEWLKGIPSHWRIMPGFTCYSEIKQKNHKLQEKTVLSLSYGRIIVKSAEKMTGLVPESFDSYQILRPGDIVIRTTDLQNDQTSLRVGFSKNTGIITSAYLGLRCKDGNHPEYLFRVLEVYDFLKVFYGMGSGLRQSLGFSDFKRLPIILPPISEQIEIAEAINIMLTNFDKLHVSLNKEIKKLSEFKSALIANVVTGKIKI